MQPVHHFNDSIRVFHGYGFGELKLQTFVGKLNFIENIGNNSCQIGLAKLQGGQVYSHGHRFQTLIYPRFHLSGRVTYNPLANAYNFTATFSNGNKFSG